MSTDTTRQTLLSRLGNTADQSAWREFETQYRSLIVGYCLRRGLQRADADDILQIVLSSLSGLFRRGFEQQPERGRFRTYLGRVTRNAIQRWLEHPSHGVQRLATEVASSMPENAASPLDEAWQDEWEQHHFRRALRSVRTNFEPASLRVFEALLAGQTIAEVASAFSMSDEAVYKVRARVRARMEDIVACQVREEDLESTHAR